eukprot:1585280-Pleurochrysis_carterae.AAC.1
MQLCLTNVNPSFLDSLINMPKQPIVDHNLRPRKESQHDRKLFHLNRLEAEVYRQPIIGSASLLASDSPGRFVLFDIRARLAKEMADPRAMSLAISCMSGALYRDCGHRAALRLISLRVYASASSIMESKLPFSPDNLISGTSLSMDSSVVELDLPVANTNRQEVLLQSGIEYPLVIACKGRVPASWFVHCGVAAWLVGPSCFDPPPATNLRLKRRRRNPTATH